MASTTYPNVFLNSTLAPEEYLFNVQAESGQLSQNIDRIQQLERSFFSGINCCYSSTYSLHALIDHYEEWHEVLPGADVCPNGHHTTSPKQVRKPTPVIAYPQPVNYTRPSSPFIDAVRSGYIPGYGYGYDSGLYSPDADLSVAVSTSPVYAKDFPECDRFEGTPPPESPYSSPSSPAPSSSDSSSFPSTASSSAISSPVCPSAPMLPEVDMPLALAALAGSPTAEVFSHDQEEGYVPSIMRKDRVLSKAQSRSERGVGKESSKGGKGKGKGVTTAEKAPKVVNKQRREKAYKCPHEGCTKSYLNPNGLKYHLEKGTCCFDPVEPEPAASSPAPASLVSSPTPATLPLPATVRAYPYPLAAPAPMVPVSPQQPHVAINMLSS